MSTHLIKLEEAGKKYVSHRFSLDLYQNDFFLISGGNGSGKTTLLMLVLGFIYPDSGSITKRKLKIGYVREKVALPPFVNVLDYLKTYARIKKGTVDMRLVHHFEVPVDKTMYELSKGNQQKVALLCALMGSPNLIVLDEPLSGLDDVTKEKFVHVLTDVYHKGVSIMISTHEPEWFLAVATKHIHL
jgi:ABC-2 type transport system ATP-binding protein